MNECSSTILVGDCIEQMRTLPSGSVQCVVTSPPYMGLRSYLPAGHADKSLEIGIEQTPDAYVARLVEAFREVRRVLRDDGVALLNLGDSYAGGGGGNYGFGKSVRSQGGQQVTNVRNRPAWLDAAGVKPKDLMMIPARVALALQADEWWLRSEIIWAKKSPMPESVRDRPTCAHEKVFLLTKSANYFYDGDAVREPCSPNSHARGKNGSMEQTRAVGLSRYHREPRRAGEVMRDHPSGRNARNVQFWTPKPFSAKSLPGYSGTVDHYATMPPDMADWCIRAGSSERGACPHCGAAWTRLVERQSENRGNAALAGTVITGKGHPSSQVRLNHDIRNGPTSIVQTVGWKPRCSCPTHEPIPQTVLDPFAGAGTTLLAANRLGRNAIGVELNPDYVELARVRIADAMAPAPVKRSRAVRVSAPVPKPDAPMPLFVNDYRQ